MVVEVGRRTPEQLVLDLIDRFGDIDLAISVTTLRRSRLCQAAIIVNRGFQSAVGSSTHTISVSLRA